MFIYMYVLYIYRRANGIYIYIYYIYPKKLQFAAYDQFVLVFFLYPDLTLKLRWIWIRVFFAGRIRARSNRIRNPACNTINNGSNRKLFFFLSIFNVFKAVRCFDGSTAVLVEFLAPDSDRSQATSLFFTHSLANSLTQVHTFFSF